MRKIICIVFLLILMTINKNAFCCSIIPISLSQRLSDASIVMIVRVVKSSFQENGLKEDNYAPISAEYQMIEIIKGNPSGIKKIISGFGNGDCGLGLAPGHFFLIITKKVNTNSKLGAWIYEGSEDIGIENPINSESIDRVRIDAIREFISTRKPIDPCFNWTGVRPPLSGEDEKRCLKVLESAYSAIKSNSESGKYRSGP